MIRFATEEDAQALLAIYAYYIDTMAMRFNKV